MRLYVSGHAVQQWQSRWRPTDTLAEARTELEAMVAEATPTKRKTVELPL